MLFSLWLLKFLIKSSLKNGTDLVNTMYNVDEFNSALPDVCLNYYEYLRSVLHSDLEARENALQLFSCCWVVASDCAVAPFVVACSPVLWRLLRSVQVRTAMR